MTNSQSKLCRLAIAMMNIIKFDQFNNLIDQNAHNLVMLKPITN